MHLPTVARIVAKSIRYPNRAVACAFEAIRLGRLDPATERQRWFDFLNTTFEVDAARLQSEFEGSEFARWMRNRRADLADFRGPYRFGSSNATDCENLYYLVRALRPRTVIETGVCYGASSAYILEALEANGTGKLYSIDLGNTNDEPPSDFFVPRQLRRRWNLCIGDVKRLLPSLLEHLKQIDLFHHDSLHTPEHMLWEYETALPKLSSTGVISSHDVNAVLSPFRPFARSPFAAFCKQHKLASETALNLGVAVDAAGRGAVPLRQLCDRVA